MEREKVKAIILDYDGTIADYRQREHLRDTDYQAYIKAGFKDTPIYPTCEIINKFRSEYKIIILSAREEQCRAEMVAWLSKYNIYYDRLILKQGTEDVEDHIAKLGLFKDAIKEYDILFAIDDRSSVVNMLRGMGIFVLQCGKGY